MVDDYLVVVACSDRRDDIGRERRSQPWKIIVNSTAYSKMAVINRERARSGVTGSVGRYCRNVESKATQIEERNCTNAEGGSVN